MQIQIIDASPKIEGKDQIVAWDVTVNFYRAPKAVQPKTYRMMPAQMTALQKVLGVVGPQDCIGKRIDLSIVCDDLKTCLESLLGPVGVTYGSVVPA